MLVGVIASTLTGFIVIALLTRVLTTVDFGLFITALTFAQLLGDLFELGINSAVLSFLPPSETNEKLSIIKASFLSKISVSIVLGVLVWLFSNSIALVVFKDSTIAPYIRVSSMGIILIILLNWGQIVFQGERKFINVTVLNGSTNFLRLIAILFLMLLGIHNPLIFYWLFFLALIISVIYLFINLKAEFLKAKVLSKDFSRLWRFGLPVGLGFAVAALHTRLDQILVFSMLGQDQAGIYGLAFRIASLATFASAAVNAAVTPRFSSIHDQDFGRYFKKTLIAVCLLTLVSLISIFVVPFLLPLFFGSKFTPSVVPFQILMVSMMFGILASPFNLAILYKFKKSKFSFYLSIISLILVLSLLRLFIPLFGINGAAFAVSMTSFAQLILTVSYFCLLKR